MRKLYLILLPVLALTVALSAGEARAQTGRILQFGPHFGLDFDTDAVVFGGQIVYGGFCSLFPLLLFDGVVSYGTGSYTYDDTGWDLLEAAGKSVSTFQDEFSIDYNVIHVQAHARYPVPLGEESDLAVHILAGPALYRWSQQDCSGEFCSDNEFTLDVGAGLVYSLFGVDVYTRLGGDVPDFSVRARVLFGG